MSSPEPPPLEPKPVPDHAEERAELQRVLDSGFFDRSPILQRLLCHICETYFAGQAHQIKEYTLAVEVFHRPPEFDSRQDPIVRVNVNRLREALTRFYAKKGRGHPIEITVPPGQYVPLFTRTSGGPAGAPEVKADSNGTPRPESGVAPGEVFLTPYRALAGGIVVGLVLAGLLLATWRPWLGARGPNPRLEPVGRPYAESALRILAGAETAAFDRLGQWWLADTYFTGGTSVKLARDAAADEGPVYRSMRKGRFRYDIPLTPGVYELRLHFVETEHGNAARGGETSRMFDVRLNGAPVFRQLDIIADAGGSRTPDIKVLTDVSPAADGLLHLELSDRRFEAILSGIEILPGLPGRMRPLRITALATPYVSADQILWEPDHWARGGATAARANRVVGTRDPGLFRAERFGNFRYTIPVAPGRYRLNLHFAETFFGPGNGGRAGVGARVFNVFCNGQTLLRDFDVLAAAGGENRALVRTFDDLEPNAQGKLLLDFVPVRNLATLTALEVLPR